MFQAHKSSQIDSKCIGKNTRIWQNCVILKGAKIGSNCNICFNVFVENEVKIGNNVTVKSGVQLWDGVEIKNNVFIGPNVTFTNDIYPRSKVYNDNHPKTVINKGASIGANTTIIAGLTIGKYSLVGAGSVVTKDIPPFNIWYGNPATFSGYITKSGTPIDINLFGKKNKEKYQLINGEPKRV